MRCLCSVLFVLGICTVPLPANAADDRDIFGTVLGEIGRQIERKQQRKLDKRTTRQQQNNRVRSLFRACSNGSVVSCDAAAKFPLNAQGRAQLARLRGLAVGRLQFERDWNACQKKELAACNAALSYPKLNDHGRSILDVMRRAALDQQQRRQDAQRRYSRLRADCLQRNLINACTVALSYSGLTNQERDTLLVWRSKVLEQKKRQQAAEAARAAAKRKQTLAQQQARQRQEAAQRYYSQLKGHCLQQEIESACSLAVKHRLASTADLALFEHKQFELLSFSQQLINRFITPWSIGERGVLISVAGLLIIMLFAAGVVLLIRQLRFSLSSSHTFASSESPQELVGEPAPNLPFAADFPLTGHMPSDVRHVLHG